MADSDLITVANRVLGTPIVAEKDLLPEDWLGLSSPTIDPQQIRKAARAALTRLQAAQGTESEGVLGLLAQRVKRAAKLRLAEIERQGSDPPSSSERAEPAAASPADGGRDPVTPPKSTAALDSNATLNASTDRGEQAQPRLVARPVARVVPNSEHSRSQASTSGGLSPVELQIGHIGPRKSRKRRATGLGLGWWIVLLLLLLLGGGGVAVTMWRPDLLGSVQTAFQATGTGPEDTARGPGPTREAGSPVPSVADRDPPVTMTPSVNGPGAIGNEADRTNAPSISNDRQSGETIGDPTGPATSHSDSSETSGSPNSHGDAGMTSTDSKEALDSSSPDQSSGPRPSPSDTGDPETPTGDPTPVMSVDEQIVGQIFLRRNLTLGWVGSVAGRSDLGETAAARLQAMGAAQPTWLESIDFLQCVLGWRREIMTTVGQRLSLLESVGELPIDDTYASVIEANSERLVLRAAGTRQEFKADALPWTVMIGVLKVTHSQNATKDQRRIAVSQSLRHWPRNRPPSEREQEIENLRQACALEGQAEPYSVQAIQHLISFVESGGDWGAVGLPAELDAGDRRLSDWAPVWDGTQQLFGEVRQGIPGVADPARSRYEIEGLLWTEPLELTKEAMLKRLLLIHRAALSRKDLAHCLDNLADLDRLVRWDNVPEFWSALESGMEGVAKDDAGWIEHCRQLADWLDDRPITDDLRDGLNSLGLRWTRQIRVRSERAQWQKRFETRS